MNNKSETILTKKLFDKIEDDGEKGHPIRRAPILAEKINTAKMGDCPYTLFLGAGASVSSGVPTAYGMVEGWKKIIQEEIDDINAENDSKSKVSLNQILLKIKQLGNTTKEYPALFGYIFQQSEERQMHIEELLENIRPGWGYFYLGGLIQAKRFNRVLTTNFDDLLNDALTHYYDNRPIVCAFDSAVSSIRIASQRPKIIKLHGDYLYDNMKNVEAELRRLDENMEYKLREMCKDFGLIVVGYNGEDESIMAPLREMIRKPGYLKMGLHWCLHLPDYKDDEISLNHPVISNELRNLIRNHRDKVHLYAVNSFDELMEKIFIKCRCKEPEILLNPSKTNLPSRFLETINHTRSSQTLSDKMVEIERRIVNGMDAKTSTPEFLIAKATSLWEEGRNNREHNRHVPALKSFKDGKSICDDLQKKKQLERIDLTRIFARMSGCCTGITKAILEIKKGGNKNKDNAGDPKVAISESINASNKGIGLYETLSPNKNEWFFLSSCYFNLLCAYGIKQKDIEKLSPEEVKHLKSSYVKFCELDLEGQRVSKLKKDPDFSSVLNIVKGLS